MGKPWEIIVGEVRRVLRDMEPESFCAALSDPPYGISFMASGPRGSHWDYSIPSANLWVELLRVLKPGAYAMLFGGTRTFHRLMVAVEDAGFLPVDTCMWMHGKGFPKNHDLSKAIDKKLGAVRTKVVGHKQSGLDMVTSGTGKTITFARGEPGAGRTGKGRDETGLIPIMEAATPQAARWEGQGSALKPAWEPIMLACKPHDGTYAENALKHGCGGLAIDASRLSSKAASFEDNRLDKIQRNAFGKYGVADYDGSKGRWPANVLLDEDAAQAVFGNSERFYYVTKASRSERDRGLEGTAVAEGFGVGALRDGGRGGKTLAGADSANHGLPRRDGQRGTLVHNDHPTVKPLDLCRYFARLLLPPPRQDGKPRRIIVPFSGSGSEMIGCLQAGWDEVVGIELNPKHAEKARLRISKGKIVQHAK